jgi:hypothetical protein
MLAYVFWHWPRAEVTEPTYEAQLSGFHASLRAHPPPGFIGSATFRVSGANWLPLGKGYEDWYCVADFQAIGLLNDAAVSGERQEPHDLVARAAAGGCAGIYCLRVGEFLPNHPPVQSWFAKPAGMRYQELFSIVGPLVTAQVGALWQRQMTLGPTPEFCIQAAASASLPAGIDPLVVAASRVWP